MLPVRFGGLTPQLFENITRDPATHFAPIPRDIIGIVSGLCFITLLEMVESLHDHPDAPKIFKNEFYLPLEDYTKTISRIRDIAYELLDKNTDNSLFFLNFAQTLTSELVKKFHSSILKNKKITQGASFEMRGEKIKRVLTSIPGTNKEWFVLQTSPRCQYRVLILTFSITLFKDRKMLALETEISDSLLIVTDNRADKAAYEGLFKLFSGVFHTSLSEEERAALRLEKDFD